MIRLSDGEQLVVHEEKGACIPADAPLTILLHGLGGDHSSPYMQRLALRLRASGQHVWRIDMRGCGAGLEYAWRPPNAARSDDLATVVANACKAFPNSPINLAGFSLGGNILLKMLGELGGGSYEEINRDQLDRIVAVAPPVDLARCSDKMNSLTGRIYTRYYLKNLNRQVEVRRQHWEQWSQIPAEPTLRTIRQFDARYTVPLSGFASTDDYYARGSALPIIGAITQPVLCLVDLNDPVVTKESFFEKAAKNPVVEYVFTRKGGHMGYWARDEVGKPIRWMELFVQHHLTRA